MRLSSDRQRRDSFLPQRLLLPNQGRNARKLRECERSGKLKTVFNSTPVEITERGVLLEVDGSIQELSNDCVWIFAGGVAPNDFLKKMGVRFGELDLTAEASHEALTVSVKN
jgi:thioredoxin reductase